MEVTAAVCSLQFRFGGAARHGQLVKGPSLARMYIIFKRITMCLYYRSGEAESSRKRVGGVPGSNLGSLGTHWFRQSKPRPSKKLERGTLKASLVEG